MNTAPVRSLVYVFAQFDPHKFGPALGEPAAACPACEGHGVIKGLARGHGSWPVCQRCRGTGWSDGKLHP